MPYSKKPLARLSPETNWQSLAEKYLMHTVKRLPVTLVEGRGAWVWDDKGKKYLDFVAGWAVDILGHCPMEVVEALHKQANLLFQASNQFYTIPQIQLAELLVKHSCFQKVFLCNSGAEANEGAVKLARRWGKLKLGGAYEVITALNSFHGRTLAMTAATGQKKFHEPYTPLPIGFVSVEYNSLEAIKKATTPQTCAIMLEPVQGEGGVNIPDKDYLKKVRAWCDDKGILLILDEIQTGVGRLGTLFGYEYFGVEPDIITLAKGLGAGVPIGAILTKEKASVFTPGEHGSTFGGNPLTCAAAYTTLKLVIEKDIPGNARKVGSYFIAGLEKLKDKFEFISGVRGVGLLSALEFREDIAEELTLACLEEGLLVNKVKPNALRFMPPLTITEKEADEALAILKKVLARRKA